MKLYNNNNNVEMTPKLALEVLMAGNERFANSISLNRNLIEQVRSTAKGQAPFAAILSCMDSRASVELVFDQGIGDIFSVRMAGNIVSEYVLGSLEYAAGVAGSKLVVVMGHTNCGAIKGACDHVELGNLTALLAKIKPAMEQETTITENRNSSNTEFVEKVAKLNVYHSLATIREESEILRNLELEGKIKIVPAIYCVATGNVEFLPATIATEVAVM